MLDNICSLPLTSDLFAQAIHPSEPILSVGLSAGHVETFRLPALDFGDAEANGQQASPSGNAQHRRLSENGFDTVDSVWRTRRHKGSCRTLVYSLDGNTLYSAGTDGLIKAAATETGRVKAKVALSQITGSKSSTADTASILCMLSPQTLILGTDSGSIHVYDLREWASSPSSRPSQTLRPHATPEDPSPSEAISSLTPLPPTSASTSGTSRSWISTSGSTLAAVDLRKGVVAVSDDQGDVLMSSVCLQTPSVAPSHNSGSRDATQRVVVGGMSGAVTIWDRGKWTDCLSRSVVTKSGGELSDDQELEQLAVVPEGFKFWPGMSGHSMIAAGMSDGRISFVKINSKRVTPIGDVYHEHGSVDGISAIGFDVAGRMISGGAQVIKIWREKSIETGSSYEEAQEVAESSDNSAGTNSANSDSEDDIDIEKHREKPRKRRKRNHGGGKHGSHGILSFQGMD